MKDKATTLSILMKVFGGVIMIGALILKGLHLFDIEMSDVAICVGMLEVLVLPIDISKIKTAERSRK